MKSSSIQSDKQARENYQAKKSPIRFQHSRSAVERDRGKLQNRRKIYFTHTMCHLFIWPYVKIAPLNGLNGSLSSLQKQNSTNSIQLSLLNWNTTSVLIGLTYILFHYVLVISTSNKKNQDHQAQTHFCAIIKPCKLLVLKDTVVMPSNNCIWLWKKEVRWRFQRKNASL